MWVLFQKLDQFPLMAPLMMDGDAGLRRADLGKVPDTCNCDHCVSQAKLDQVTNIING